MHSHDADLLAAGKTINQVKREKRARQDWLIGLSLDVVGLALLAIVGYGILRVLFTLRGR